MNVSQTLAIQCLFLVQFKPLHPVGDQPCCLELLLLCWLGNWGSGTLSKPWCFPQAGCDNVCTLFVWTHPVPWDIFVLDQGSNHQPLLWKHRVLTTGSPGKSPHDSFFFLEANYFTILYWFCHILTWIHHGCTCVPHPEPPSHLPPHPIPLGHPSAPAPSTPYHTSHLDWWFITHMIIYMFQCHSPKSSHPRPLPESKRLFYTSVSLLLSYI